MTHEALIERLEKATGPDREIALAIYDAVDPRRGTAPLDVAYRLDGEPDYTGSIDAALALVERKLPERGWFAGLNDNGRYCAAIDGPTQYVGSTPHSPPEYYREPINAEAATPALALLIALLRALDAIDPAKAE